jgi:uncharacterized Fe-S cluster-containing radical SAM superfamily protein
MRSAVVSEYLRELDQQERRITSPADPVTTTLRAFRAYHPQARVTFVNVDGRQYWLTGKMMRVHAVVTRVSKGKDQMTTIRAIAAETRVSPGYVSKVIERFEKWSFIKSVRTKGRYGGIFLMAVKSLVSRIKARIRQFNVSSVSPRGGVNISSSAYREETLNRWTPDELEGIEA